MRNSTFGLLATLLLMPAGTMAQDTSSAAQQDVPKTVAPANADTGFVNQIDIGARGTSFGAGSDQARYQRYQDLRNGGFLDRLRINKTTDRYLFALEADHVGYRDQRFLASYHGFGKVKASFEWNQIPLFYSQTTQSLYTETSPGVLTLPTSVQLGIQNKTLTLASAVTGASVFDTRSQRDVANGLVTYSATRNVDLSFTFKNTTKTGNQPFAGSFGISGAIATEFAVPLDHRTTEFGSKLEWADGTRHASVAYDGSFFRNNIPTLVWANPSLATDSATLGPASGRMSMWPNTDSNTVSAAVGTKLPGHSNANAYVSMATLSNNDPLLPFTDNTKLVSPTLDRTTADVKAKVTAMNYIFTSRPTSMLWFSARYRQYKFDNQTTPFLVTTGVNYDTALVVLNKESEPLGYTRRTFDADASFSPWRYVGFRGGYTREDIDRTYRIVEKTTENTGRVSVDLTGLTYVTVRGVYEHAIRTASPVDETELLALGEQPTLRQFDISDRNLDRFSAVVQVTPVSMLSLNASASVSTIDYPGTNYGLRTTAPADIYGLRNQDSHVYVVGFDLVPMKPVSFGVSYGYEKNTALQTSRTANPLPANTLANLNDPTQQFNDPRRDWTDNSADRVHYTNASADFIKVIPKTDVKVAYDYTRAESAYTYGLGANTVIAAPVQLPTVTNEQQRGTVDGRYFVTSHLALGGVYWYDRYTVNDFALNPLSSLAQPATGTAALMMVGYYYAPYTAHTFMGRLTYLW